MDNDPRPEAGEQDVTANPTADQAKPRRAAEDAPAEEGVVIEETAPERAAADEAAGSNAELASAQKALRERTEDLQRLQAEYVNYKRRVDRDRDVARNAGVESVVLDLLPVLDDLRIAREHEEMTGGFKLLVEELEKVTVKYGVESFGEKGEPFDPQIHDALMQAPMPGVSEPTVLDVMQLGYKFRGRVLRAARVAVGMPADDAPEAPAKGAKAEAEEPAAE
ncbi:nucleotide exchange factor GrpE [Ammonicoccus fulvus]|uniref:Protein GrpE n=1 Tax=Ammonicoccus fulvus TaxID=3138240 RepID=A0ABZ3FM49_9ACTN